MRSRNQRSEGKGILGVSGQRLKFFAEVFRTDWIVGQLMDCLESNGLGEDTLVLLVTDKGGTDE